MTDVLLHIGLHRTGTTAIQLFLTENRAFLRQHGFLYPNAGTPSREDVGHHLLPWSILSREQYIPSLPDKPAHFTLEGRERLWKELQSELETERDVKGVILSSEEFSVLAGSEIGALGERLRGHRLRVLVYLRRQDELLESLYSASIVLGGHHGGVWEDIQDFSRTLRTRLNFYELLSDWRDRLPGASIEPRIYDDPEVRADVVRDFVARAGLPVATAYPKPPVRVNASLPVQAVEVIRILAEIHGGPSDLATVRRAFERGYAKLGAAPPFTLLGEDERARLFLQYTASNDALGREFLGGDGTPFSKSWSVERAALSRDAAFCQGVLDLSRALLE